MSHVGLQVRAGGYQRLPSSARPQLVRPRKSSLRSSVRWQYGRLGGANSLLFRGILAASVAA
jgi:hypothetical protein